MRTGVTAIFPRGRDDLAPVFAGWFSLNGNGEMTGTAWIDDYGLLFYPIAITNTNSVGTVRDALIEWGATGCPTRSHCCLPVVAETWDGDLNDIFGFHVKKAHAFAALAAAASGPVAEGNVGGRHRHAVPGLQGRHRHREPAAAERGGGRGRAASRSARWCSATSGSAGSFGSPGIPVARELQVPEPCYDTTRAARLRAGAATVAPPSRRARRPDRTEHGSIIVVLATDAPLLPHQLRRLARRAALGVGRMGGIAGAGSGDLFIAFSTAPTGTPGPTAWRRCRC